MTAGPSRRGRHRVLAVVLASVALLAAACGGEDGTASGAGDGGAETAGATSGDASGDRSGPLPACPDRSTMVEVMDRSTYHVYGEFDGAGGGELRYLPLGAAWGVDDRVLVTTANVADAFESGAEAGLQLQRAVAIQSGTGDVVELLRVVVHPDHSGDPLRSPDVALLTTRDSLPTVLPLAPETVELAIGDELLMVGFPGGSDGYHRPLTGPGVPRTTTFTGEVSTLQGLDAGASATAADVELVEHGTATAPGTSGAPIVVCDEVVAVNNPGTAALAVAIDDNGAPTVERRSATATNLGLHVRHLHMLLELFEANAVQGLALPVDATAPIGAEMADGQPPAQSVTLNGSVTDPVAAHEFTITIGPDGSITGTSRWPETGEFTLTGELRVDGSVVFTDDAPERLDFRRGTYQGEITLDATIEGVYFEETREGDTWPFTAVVG